MHYVQKLVICAALAYYAYNALGGAFMMVGGGLLIAIIAVPLFLLFYKLLRNLVNLLYRVEDYVIGLFRSNKR